LGGLELTALWVPGHTLGALAYVAAGAVFTGDTMFHAGAGRLFEGTAEMLYRSLHTVLAALPAQTRVYPGHEYTVQNLVFAAAMAPDDEAIRARLAWAREARSRGEPTVGATLAEELATNPFLRCKDAAELGRLRRAKDEFRAG
jgi:hydroxyacylglutathione hydrolase